MITNFAIITSPRSGSEYLRFMLGCNKAISCNAELFQHKVMLDLCDEYSVINPIECVDRKINEYYDLSNPDLMVRADGDDIALGYKIMYSRDVLQNHFGFMVDRYLANNNFQLIHLKRRNILNRFVSAKMANKTGIWTERSYTDKIPETIRVTVNLDEFDWFINDEYRANGDFKLKYSDSNVFEVCYEDFIKTPDVHVKEICDFLNVKYEQYDKDFIEKQKPLKQRKQTLRNLVLNYDDVEKYLKRINKSEWLDE